MASTSKKKPKLSKSKLKKVYRVRRDIYNKLLNYIVDNFIKKRKRRPTTKGKEKAIAPPPRGIGFSSMPSLAQRYQKEETKPPAAEIKMIMPGKPSQLVQMITDGKTESELAKALSSGQQKLLKDLAESKEIVMVNTKNNKIMNDWDLQEAKEMIDKINKNKNDAEKVEVLEKDLGNFVQENANQNSTLETMSRDNRRSELYDAFNITDMREIIRKYNKNGFFNPKIKYTKMIKIDLWNIFYEIPEVRNEIDDYVDDISSKRITEAVSRGLEFAMANKSIDIEHQEKKVTEGSGEMNLKKINPEELKPLSNIDIDNIMKSHQGFIDTFSVDNLNKLDANTINDIKSLPNVSFIINTIPSGEQRVGHWVSVNIMREPPTVEYYDSFGRPPEALMMREIKRFLKSISQPKSQFKINHIQDQDTRTANCGWFAMQFLKARYVGNDFRTSTGFNSKGEKNIRAFKKFYKKFQGEL